MLELPQSTAYGRRIPKQKFYENLEVSPEIRRLFVDQVQLITWANKLSPKTMNIAPGREVGEIEVLHLRLRGNDLDPRVLRLMDRQIPHHILFLLERADGTCRLTITYKEAGQGGGAFQLRRSFQTEWTAPESLELSVRALDMDALYARMVRQIAGEALAAPEAELREAVRQAEERDALLRRLERLRGKMKRERQLSRQMELRREVMKLEKILEEWPDGQTEI